MLIRDAKIFSLPCSKSHTQSIQTSQLMQTLTTTTIFPSTSPFFILYTKCNFLNTPFFPLVDIAMSELTGSADFASGLLGNKRNCSRDRWLVTPRASPSPAALAELVLVAEYQEWPFKRTKIENDTTYNLVPVATYPGPPPSPHPF